MTDQTQAAIRAEWHAMLTLFEDAKAVDAACADDAPNVDEVTAMYGDAIDLLIEAAPAPDVAAVAMKLRLALERSAPFEAMFDDHRNAILADLDRLAAAEEMPLTVADSWNAYSDAITLVARTEMDPTITPQRRANHALDAHRAWQRWCRAMDRANPYAPRLVATSFERTAA